MGDNHAWLVAASTGTLWRGTHPNLPIVDCARDQAARIAALEAENRDAKALLNRIYRRLPSGPLQTVYDAMSPSREIREWIKEFEAALSRDKGAK